MLSITPPLERPERPDALLPPLLQQSAALAVLDRNIAKIKDRLDNAIAYRLALEVILFDNNVQASALLFMRYQMVWLLKLVDGTHQYPHQVLRCVLCCSDINSIS